MKIKKKCYGRCDIYSMRHCIFNFNAGRNAIVNVITNAIAPVQHPHSIKCGVNGRYCESGSCYRCQDKTTASHYHNGQGYFEENHRFIPSFLASNFHILRIRPAVYCGASARDCHQMIRMCAPRIDRRNLCFARLAGFPRRLCIRACVMLSAGKTYHITFLDSCAGDPDSSRI